MDELKNIRLQIDQLDQKIMQLLDQRFSLTNQVGEIKKRISKDVLDTNREQIIMDKVSKYSHYPQIKEVYTTIMDESKKAQRE